MGWGRALRVFTDFDVFGSGGSCTTALGVATRSQGAAAGSDRGRERFLGSRTSQTPGAPPHRAARVVGGLPTRSPEEDRARPPSIGNCSFENGE